MSNQSTIYPNLTWAQFEMFNDNRTDSFEEMCKDLFICEFLKDNGVPHADHNNPGVEVIPVLEPPHDNGQPQRYISFQAKYFKTNISDAKIIESLKQAVKHYSGKLDVVYLFCNKVITKDSNRYRKYLNILQRENIELELVTDRDIFSLLRKYHRVADYFFQDRKRAMVDASGLMNSVAFASSVSDVESQEQPEMPHAIIHELINEKLQKCRNAVCDLKFGELKSELDFLSKIGADSSETKINFYRIILAAHEKVEFTEIIGSLPEDLKEEAYWLKNFSRNIRAVKIDELIGLSVETQIVVLDLLFSTQHWDCIIDLFAGRYKLPQEVLKAFDFHYGLSLFNLGECNRSHEILNSLYEQYHEQRFKLYDICALLKKANREFIYGNPGHEKTVKDLLDQLDAVKELVTDQIKANEPLIAVLELQACFNLGANEKRYLDEAFVRYASYSDKAKSNDGVRLFTGLCFGMAGELEKASEMFSNCAWRDEETLASRYLTSLVDLKKYREAVNAFEALDDKVKTPHTEAIYLLALYRMGYADYNVRLRDIANKFENSLKDLFIIGFYVEDNTVFDEIILPKISVLIPERLPQTSLQDKIRLLALLAYNNKLELLEQVLNSIPDLQVVNRFLSHDIYKCLFSISNDVYEATHHNQEVKNDLRIVERIADRFIEADIQKRDFLQIRLLCASANHMVFSMLKYSKELFEYTHDTQTARNIIALLYERNETNAEEYEPYLSFLTESDEPIICIAVASAKLKLGYLDEANYYAYKAIYQLDGVDDFDVYKGLFGLHSLTLQRIKEKTVRKSISPNVIVTLETEGEKWKIALDSEDDFGDSDNRSLGVEHIGRTDPVYIKLIGTGRKQVLNLRGKKYKVVDFEPREAFVGRYVYQKVQEHPEEFKGTVWVISTEDIDEMIKQMLALSDHKEQTEDLLNAYNFGTCSLGIPVDFFVQGNYKKYITAQKYLLDTKDLAYYAGEPCPKNMVESKYVPALSTLVLLATKGWLDTLDWLGDCIVIPDSYMPFFKEQYAVEVETQANSAGALVPLDDGKFTIIEPDKKIPEIWESIIAKCENYPTENVSDDERIAYEVLEGYTWERLFADTCMDTIQLDALIVAEREKGVYFCDDLFFRKIAAHRGVKNINFATLLYAQENLDLVMPILMELSKNNYVYTPFRCRDNAEGQQLVQNLLEGEKKKVYYSDFFNTYIYVRDQIMKQYFGDDR